MHFLSLNAPNMRPVNSLAHTVGVREYFVIHKENLCSYKWVLKLWSFSVYLLTLDIARCSSTFVLWARPLQWRRCASGGQGVRHRCWQSNCHPRGIWGTATSRRHYRRGRSDGPHTASTTTRGGTASSGAHELVQVMMYNLDLPNRRHRRRFRAEKRLSKIPIW